MVVRNEDTVRRVLVVGVVLGRQLVIASQGVGAPFILVAKPISICISSDDSSVAVLLTGALLTFVFRVDARVCRHLQRGEGEHGVDVVVASGLIHTTGALDGIHAGEVIEQNGGIIIARSGVRTAFQLITYVVVVVVLVAESCTDVTVHGVLEVETTFGAQVAFFG